MGGPGAHNQSARAAPKTPYQFEESAGKRPSRRSSRRGETRMKPDASLRLTAVNRSASPAARASRGRAVRR
jgi:hypothetical protein